MDHPVQMQTSEQRRRLPSAKQAKPLAVGTLCLATAASVPSAVSAYTLGSGSQASLRGRPLDVVRHQALQQRPQQQQQHIAVGSTLGSRGGQGVATHALTATPVVLAVAGAAATRRVLRQRHGIVARQPGIWRQGQATVVATAEDMAQGFDFENLETHKLAELDELYIDALWAYYREGKSLLTDEQYSKLKQTLYKLGSNFPTLQKDEVAFIEASIAYYRGAPVVSDAAYEELKAKVAALGKRQDVVAFLLYERGEQFLDDEQYQLMKDEYEKLGITAVDLEKCTVAQMEEMYVDALWAYYHDGVQLLTDEQYNKIKFELQCEGSGFPWLDKDEIDFVKASMSYYRGDSLLSDDEWNDLKARVLSRGKSKEITAFLLYSKGKEMLDPQTFEDMRNDLARMGVTVQKLGTKAMEQTLNVSNPELKNDVAAVLVMVSALALFPTLISTGLVWAIGLFYDWQFVPEFEWQAVLQQEFLPLFGIGLGIGMVLTYCLLVFLDLQGPRILCGQCPSCSSEVKMFSGGANPVEQVEYACKSCGCKMVLNTRSKRIQAAGMGARIEPPEPETFNFRSAWNRLKDSLLS